MYTPAPFEETDKNKIYEFIKHHSFAILFSQHNEIPTATHLPLLLDQSKSYLYGHMARANPQWQDMVNDVLVVFQGPHAYISPSWYETNQAVPTWNYTAVHVTGKFTLIEEHHELLQILEQTTSAYESNMSQPWNMSSLDPKLLNQLSTAIIGFKIEISTMEGKWKLSQNHAKERRQRVIHALEEKPDDHSKQIAQLMSKSLD